MVVPSVVWKRHKKAMIAGTFWKIGFKNRKWISFNQVKMVSDDKRKKWLSQLERKFACMK